MGLALCHNVTPVYNEYDTSFLDEEGVKKDKTKNFQASSPDEIAFVKTVGKFGIELISRTQT